MYLSFLFLFFSVSISSISFLGILLLLLEIILFSFFLFSTQRNAGENYRHNSRSGISTQFPASVRVTIEESFPNIDVVLGLRTKKLHDKVPYNIFAERAPNYVITTLKYDSYIENMLCDMINQFSFF